MSECVCFWFERLPSPRTPSGANALTGCRRGRPHKPACWQWSPARRERPPRPYDWPEWHTHRGDSLVRSHLIQHTLLLSLLMLTISWGTFLSASILSRLCSSLTGSCARCARNVRCHMLWGINLIMCLTQNLWTVVSQSQTGLKRTFCGLDCQWGRRQ